MKPEPSAAGAECGTGGWTMHTGSGASSNQAVLEPAYRASPIGNVVPGMLDTACEPCAPCTCPVPGFMLPAVHRLVPAQSTRGFYRAFIACGAPSDWPCILAPACTDSLGPNLGKSWSHHAGLVQLGCSCMCTLCQPPGPWVASAVPGSTHTSQTAQAQSEACRGTMLHTGTSIA